MPHRCVSLAVLLLGTLAVVLASIAQQGPTEAPTGFDTATLAQSAGSQSVSNGIAQPALCASVAVSKPVGASVGPCCAILARTTASVPNSKTARETHLWGIVDSELV